MVSTSGTAFTLVVVFETFIGFCVISPGSDGTKPPRTTGWASAV